MAEQQFLVFESFSNKIAINLEYVLEVIRMPNWTPYPNSSEYIKGIFNLRNKIIPLIDFRKLLGHKSFDDTMNELIDTLKEREQDHRNWLNELDKSVIEDREFSLTTDPRKCKFGLWYYSYKAENSTLELFLNEFEEPHKEIHNIAIKVAELRKQNKKSEALEVVQQAKGKELKKMIDLFGELYILLRNSIKEFVVIVNTNNGIKSYTVDKINQIIKVNDNEISIMDDAKLKGTAKEVIKKDGELILKLDIQSFLEKI